jgi:WD repeat-containing protein 35
MTETAMTEDQIKLLILISKFSRPAKSRDAEETWVKKIPLMAMVYRGVRQNVFRGYDIAPTLVEYMGTVRYANISKEGEDDIVDLREMKYVERLKLATSHHYYVSAYRITPEGVAKVAALDQKYKKIVEKLIKCKKCGGGTEIETREDAPYLLCKQCDEKEKVDIFAIEELSYISAPEFAPIWLPPD